MRRFLIFIVMVLMAIPTFAQKLSKEEKAAQNKALYETMVKALEECDWAIVPTSYIDKDGIEYHLTNNVTFVSYEKTNIFIQGTMVCNNSYTNIAEVKDYELVKDKKGNFKNVIFVVQGRHIHGTYKIILPKVDNGNVVDVFYTQPGYSVKRFRGPIVPSKVANFYKRSNPE